MKILRYTDNREEIKTQIRPYLEKQLMIPYIGAGFSKTERTKSGGFVPSGWEMQQTMIKMLQNFAGYSEKETEYYRNENLNDFADVFFMELKETEPLQTEFRAYMKKNFRNIFDLPDEKKKFLNVGWPSIYTLNYDDAIESSLEGYNVIYPYDTQSDSVKNAEKCIYKMHGDVSRYLNTGDLKYIVLGKKQYVQFLKDEDNNDMMKTLQNNFYSKSVLFIGCSLTNEMDLMYTAEIQLSQKSGIDKDHVIIYIRFVENDEYDLSRHDENQLKMYGITHVINANAQEICDLYHDLYDMGVKSEKENLTGAIEKFCDFKIQMNDRKMVEEDLEFFRSQRVDISTDNHIMLPSYFLSRKTIQENIIGHLRSNNDTKSIKHVYFLAGQKVSGRTFALLDIVRDLKIKKVFYFPSGTTLSDETMNEILSCHDAYFLFDENVLTRDILLDILPDNLEMLRKNHLFMVVAINRSDGKFFQYYVEHRDELDADVAIVNLPSAFKEGEIKRFNDGIRHLSLINYKNKDTILDYLYKVRRQDLQSNDAFMREFDVHFLKKENISVIKSMIVLATELRVGSKMAVELEIDAALYGLMERYGKFIQKYYTVRSIERDGASGFKFVLNSSSWVIQVLSSFANDRNNHAAVAKAYRSIFFYYRKFYKNDKLFHHIVRKYSFLDDIQMLFCNRRFGGSLLLPDCIYEEIRPLLSDEFQFLHQSAKCKLQLAKKNSLAVASKYLEDANRDITRAYDLAKNCTYKNIDYTLLHMSLTEALIVTNYIFNGVDSKGNPIDFKKQQERAIEAYYRTFCEFDYIENQFDRKEIKDVDKFIQYMVREKQVSTHYARKLSDFVTEFRDMRNEFI